MDKQRIISKDDPRLLNPTFDFKIPFSVSDSDRDSDEINLSEDDDFFTCTAVNDLINNGDIVKEVTAVETRPDIEPLLQNIFENEDDDFFTSTAINKLVDAKQRFTDVSTSEEIVTRITNNAPKKTRYQNSWAIGIWQAWAGWRNKDVTDPSIINDPYRYVPIDIKDVTEKLIGFWLTHFVLEVKNQKGKPYPPRSLHNICCGIQRHYNTCVDHILDGEFKKINVFDKNNPNFYKFYEVCDNRMRELTAQGYGQNVEKADEIEEEDEEILWDTGILNSHTAQGLLYGVYFYNVRCFSLRGGEIHRTLEKEQFTIRNDVKTGVRVLRYSERLSKSNKGGLKHLKVQPLKNEIFAQPDNPRCVVDLFSKYLALIPDNGPFYRQVSKSKKNDDFFSASVIGKNTLSGFLPEIFKKAGIDVTVRKITGHSGRVTVCSKLFNAGYQEKSVKERSGHRSDAVQSYMRESRKMKLDISDLLQSKKPKYEPSTSTSTITKPNPPATEHPPSKPSSTITKAKPTENEEHLEPMLPASASSGGNRNTAIEVRKSY